MPDYIRQDFFMQLLDRKDPAGRVPAGRIPSGKDPENSVPAGKGCAAKVPAGKGFAGKVPAGKFIFRITALLLALSSFISSAPVFAGDPIPDREHDYLVRLETDYGDMVLVLFDATPMHKENFVELAKAGVYDGIIFHRVIEHFMIQSGDPATSNVEPAWEPGIIPPHVPAEFDSRFSHRRGTVGAARYGAERNPMKNSSPTQFYIVRHDRAAPHLDGEYTVFGQVMSGLEVIDKIAEKPTDERDRPLEEVRINKVRVDVVKRADIIKFYNYSY